jgi:hypothetical protein
MFQDAAGLLCSDARKPFQKFLHRRAAFNVLEQRGHRDARAGEAAQILRISRVTLYQRINAGLIQIQKDGRRSVVTASELQRYANSSH